MTNAGRRVIERETGKTKPEIVREIQTFNLSTTLITALFLGAAHKHHFKRFPSVVQVDAYMDELEDAGDAEDLKQLYAALMASYLGTETGLVYDAYYAEPDDLDDSEGDGEDVEGEDESSPKAEPAPKPSAKPRAQKK